jgi:hypothetical protein
VMEVRIYCTDPKDELGLGHRNIPQGRGHRRRRPVDFVRVPKRFFSVKGKSFR